MPYPQTLSPFSKERYVEEIHRLRSIVSMQKDGWIQELCDFLKQALLQACEAAEKQLAELNKPSPYDLTEFFQARLPFAESAGKVIWDYWSDCIRSCLAKPKRRHRRLRDQDRWSTDTPTVGILSSEHADALLCVEELNITRAREMRKAIENIKNTKDPATRAEWMTVKFYYEVFEPFAIAYIADLFAELEALIREKE